MNFGTAIQPLDVGAFSDRYLGKMWLRHEGRCDAYTPLLSWRALNAALNQIRLPPGAKRLKLVCGGRGVDPSRYLIAADGDHGSMLDTAGFEACLADGATLVLDYVDDLFPEIRELAETAEATLRAKVKVNLYAGWRTQNGFDLHWDVHDTLILQVAGRKEWTVYEPTRLHPTPDDVARAEPPAGDPLWHGILEEGSFLFMPRGWWHVARPLDEPSLHVTVGITAPRGEQFLKWLIHEQLVHEEVRADVPLLASPEIQAQYLDRLRQWLAAALTGDVMARFAEYVDSKVTARPSVDLPGSVVARSRVPLTRSSRVRVAGGRAVSLASPLGQDATCSIGAATWQVDPALVPALKMLSGVTDYSVGELCAAVDPAFSGRMKMLLLELCASGALVAHAPVVHAS